MDYNPPPITAYQQAQQYLFSKASRLHSSFSFRSLMFYVIFHVDMIPDRGYPREKEIMPRSGSWYIRSYIHARQNP